MERDDRVSMERRLEEDGIRRNEADGRENCRCFCGCICVCFSSSVFVLLTLSYPALFVLRFLVLLELVIFFVLALFLRIVPWSAFVLHNVLPISSSLLSVLLYV